MHGGLASGLQMLSPIVVTLMSLAALLLLWRASRSVWLIVAMAGELVGLMFNIVVLISPMALQDISAIYPLWRICGLVFAGGLLGYAIEVTRKVSVQ